MKSSALTTKQLKVFHIIQDYMNQHHQAPTLQELQGLIGARYIRSVSQYLDALEEKGFITRDRNQSRSIRLLTSNIGITSSTITLPVIASVGCDDMSVFLQETYDEYIEVDPKLFEGTRQEDVFVVQAKGQSMVNAGLNDGDYVLVERIPSLKKLKNDDIVVAVVEGMTVLKRIRISKKVIVLYPESDSEAYQPIILSKDNFSIVGRLIEKITMGADDVSFVYDSE